MSARLADLLASARQQVPAAEARSLLRHLLDCSSAWLAAHTDAVVSADTGAHLSALVARRAAGEPLAYLMGVREFYGYDFRVTPEVLIPRPETELLVDLIKQKVGAGGTAAAPRLLDLGCGSGCIAVALALELPHMQVTAVDVSPAALAVARDNAKRLGATVDCVLSDWFSALPAQRFDWIVGNPPYIAEHDPHLSAGDLRFEPAGALTDRADGLAALRRIIAAAPHWLVNGGGLWLEHGYNQAAAVHRLLVDAGFGEIEQHRDLAGIVRVSGGKIA